MTVNAKDVLQCCRSAVLELRKLNDQLARCLPTGQPSGVKAQQYDANPPGTNEPTAAAIQLYDGLMAQRAELALQVSRISKIAWDILRTVRDARLLAILNSYYLLGMTDQEIAQVQGLTRVYINQLRHAAVDKLN